MKKQVLPQQVSYSVNACFLPSFRLMLQGWSLVEKKPPDHSILLMSILFSLNIVRSTFNIKKGGVIIIKNAMTLSFELC
jgi:hypothetical protein